MDPVETRARARASVPTSNGGCLCRGVTQDGACAIWVAFLDADNHQYEGERCGWDYMCCSSDVQTYLVTRSWKKHCQILFWDARTHSSVTVDVNGTRGRVFEASMKEFSRVGWTFVRLRITPDTERRALAFMREQVGKPMNRTTNWFVCGAARPGAQKSFFCSELVVHTLQHIGYARDVRAESMTPGSLFDYLMAGGPGIKGLQPRIDAQHVVRHRRFWADYERETEQLEADALARARPALRQTQR